MINGIVGDNGAFALMRARAQYADMANAVATKKAENARMREQWRRLETDPSAIEDIARRELDLIKPGEMLFIVRDAPGARKKEER
ncbi:MAG: septum formation initiator family protein [Acidobacteria bacterium]|nr:septum formation initiator family protein [Acidobacteriota bacterium]